MADGPFFLPGDVAYVVLISILLLVGGVFAVAGESRTELLRRARDLTERHEKCEANARIAYQRRLEATQKPYLSAEDRQKTWERLDRALEAERACVAQAAAELVKSETALEIQSQRDLDEVQAKLAQAAPAERPGLERPAIMRPRPSTGRGSSVSSARSWRI